MKARRSIAQWNCPEAPNKRRPGVLRAGVIALTGVSAQILGNNAAAVLLFLIAASAAGELGVDPGPFIICVYNAAGAGFTSTIGRRSNLLVYAPRRPPGFKITRGWAFP